MKYGEPGGWLHQLASWRRRKDCCLTNNLLLPTLLLPQLGLDLLLDPLLLLLKLEHSRAQTFILKSLPMTSKGLCRI